MSKYVFLAASLIFGAEARKLDNIDVEWDRLQLKSYTNCNIDKIPEVRSFITQISLPNSTDRRLPNTLNCLYTCGAKPQLCSS